MKCRGFVLQASYRTLAERDGSRIPVVHLYGRLEDGATFLVRDRRPRPQFYIQAADAQRAREVGIPTPHTTEQTTFAGAPVLRLQTQVPADVPAIRERLHAAGIDTYEADVRFAVRYLIERGVKGGCEIEGEAVAGSAIHWIFDEPLLRPAAVGIEPRILAFDIETDARSERLLAIALYGTDLDEVLIVDGSTRPMPERTIRCADEREALTAFCQRVAQFDPDVITGWNIVDFDLSVLQKIAERLRHPLALGRDAGAMRIRKAEGYFGSGNASIPGRLVLDGIDLLRGAFIRMDDYSLDAVARSVLGEGKAVAGAVQDRIAEIQHNYRHDLAAFALYARTDARLALQIVNKLNLVELAFARSRLTGMSADRVAASIASFDFLYLAELEQRRVVAPTVRNSDARVHVAQAGGHVLEPVPGLHANVWVFDFKSLYPSVIRTFNIDPLSYVAEPLAHAELLVTEGGAHFRRAPGILPGILDALFPQREAAKRAGNEVASHAIKILMNSFYGVLGTPACRFYNPALANAITGQGRHVLQWSQRWFEASGFKVLYGDTDSLFVLADGSDAERAHERGRQLAVALNRELADYIEQRWRVTSRLELQFAKLYLKLFLPRTRHGTSGARKRYAGLLHSSRPDVEFVGMEVVRSDWTELAKRVQRELYSRLFHQHRVDQYLAEVVAQVRRGELDDALIYHKNLRKDADSYTTSTPPHVAAARKSSQHSGRMVSYVMTTAGPEPTDNLRHPLDREHYVLKQIKPVAEPVLGALGLDFERVIGDNRQLDMYS